jgi:hypothetical protein
MTEIYYLGVIDCLTPYTFVKRIETFWKSLSHPKYTVSAVPANEYGDRFFGFIKSVVTWNTRENHTLPMARLKRRWNTSPSSSTPKVTAQSAPPGTHTEALDSHLPPLSEHSTEAN